MAITRIIKAKFPGRCRKCNGALGIGEEVAWHRASAHGGRGSIYHPPCAPTEGEAPPPLAGRNDAVPTEPPQDVPTDAMDALARELLPRLEKLGIKRGGGDEQTRTRDVYIVKREGALDVTVDMPHPLFETLLTLATARLHAYAWGAPGAGKSFAAHAVASVLGLGYRYVSLCPQSMPSLLMGYMDAHGKYVRTAFRETYEHGGVFCIDEVDNANANLLATLNSALANGIAEFPDAQVPRHADFVIVATGNTQGAGPTLAFPDRRPLDLAFRDRFVFLKWTYAPEHERAIARQLAGSDNALVEAGEAWAQWIHVVRAHCEEAYPSLVASPRAIYSAVPLLARLDVADVADLVLFQGIEDGVRKGIVEACPMPRIKRPAEDADVNAELEAQGDDDGVLSTQEEVPTDETTL